MSDIRVPEDVLPRYMAMSTWKQQIRKSASKGSSETGARRQQKRSRLGNAQDRALYKSTKASRNPKYGKLCERADRMNGR